MSETTTKLRAFQTYSVGACGVRDIAADAIEAVEAQVAAVAARVAALEPSPLLKCVMCDGPHDVADHPDVFDPPKPAPSAVPAPRGFRVGDRVRITNAHTCSSEWIGCEGRIVAPAGGFLGDWTIGDLTKFAHLKTVPMYSQALTLVRAADAPEAPAEDAGLVERLARIIVDTPCAANHEGQCIPPGAPLDDCDRANARAVLSALTAESRLCAPDEVARLTKERNDWKYAAEVQKKDMESWKARAEAAEKELAEARAISAATAERVRTETQSATELRKDLDDAKREASVWKRECEMFSKAWSRELGPRRPKSHLIDELVVGTKDLVAERDALRAELNALRAKPRFRTRKVRAKDAEAFDKEYYKREYTAGYEDYARAMNAVGLRRRVDGAK